jgi:protein PhnA
MARGKEEYGARIALLNSFGKDLARRAKSKCELCGASGEKLGVFEVPPEEREPRFERCIMLCESCTAAFEKPEKFEGDERWRFLAEAAWSEFAPVQVLAVRLLRRMAEKSDWAREAEESLYLDEEIEEWVTEGA